MPIRTTSCNFRDEGSTTYVSFPTGCLPEFAKTFHDGCRHQGKVLLVFDRERQMLQVVTRKRFQILNEELKSRTDTHPTTDAADRAESIAAVDRNIENIPAAAADD